MTHKSSGLGFLDSRYLNYLCNPDINCSILSLQDQAELGLNSTSLVGEFKKQPPTPFCDSPVSCLLVRSSSSAILLPPNSHKNVLLG